MSDITTEAWVLHRGQQGVPDAGVLKKELYSFPDITEDEVLVEPLFGSWEGNMSHALQRDPVDICRMRREDRIVLGNSGVLRVLRIGSRVSGLREGDLGVIAPAGLCDKYGYLVKVVAYDAPHTVGLLAKQTKFHKSQVVKLPYNTKYSLQAWAAFSVRYSTAWSNWKIAYGCFRLQVPEADEPAPFVCGWGGGTSLAEVSLARIFGCRASLIASKESRLNLLKGMGIVPIDRRKFSALNFDHEKYESDREYRKRYLQAEATFLGIVREVTDGDGVAIFIDNIGTPVVRATLKALGRQGVITTIGWKEGTSTCFSRPPECINRHIHVHTHGSGLVEGADALNFAEDNNWLPPVTGEVHAWNDIPQLAHDYASGKIETYFPVYQVNSI